MMTRDSTLGSDKVFNQVMAAALAAAVLLALAAPWLAIPWLIGKRLEMMRAFCSQVRKGEYDGALPVPNESRESDNENEMIALMRDMNWMARLIQVREDDLHKAITALSESRCQLAEQKKYLEKVNGKLLVTQRRLKQRTKELEDACYRMQVMAMTDPLTELANRRCFFTAMEQEFRALVGEPQPISLLILDIDHFKKINDRYGHHNGDKVLAAMGRILRQCTRSNDIAARIGGEEFAILLPQTDFQGATVVAQKIQADITGHSFLSVDGMIIPVTVSIGICTLSQPPYPDIGKFYCYADQALYRSKAGGRDAISAYDPYEGSFVRLPRSVAS